MPRRRGFLARVAQSLARLSRGLGDVLGGGGKSPPSEVPPPPPQPPDFFPPPAPSPRLTRENQVWRDIARGVDKADAEAMDRWFQLYRDAVEPLQMDEDEFYQFWGDFLKAFYLVSGERGSIQRDTFYRHIGIRKRDFQMDWQVWREVKRGTP